jgi:hypothetical protein
MMDSQMNNDQYLSVEGMQRKHLQSQQKHLRFVQKYHAWIMSESHDPKLKQLHQSIADAVGDALEHVGVLIEALGKSEDRSDAEQGG